MAATALGRPKPPFFTGVLAPVLIGVTLAAAAMPATAQIDTSLSLTNSAPVVQDVTLTGLVAPYSVTPNSGTTKGVTFNLVVLDLNGCNDLSSVSVTVKDPSDADVVTSAAATYSSCSALTAATYTYAHTVNFYDAPGTYKIQVQATDSKGATGNNLLSLTTFTVAELVAISLGSATLSFGGSLDPGDTSAAQSVSIQNHGNVVIDAQVSGTALAHDGTESTIPVSNIKWSLASDMSGPTALSGSATTASAFDLAKGASSSKAVYLHVAVPEALPSGDYAGTLTLGAVKSA